MNATSVVFLTSVRMRQIYRKQVWLFMFVIME